MSESVQSQCGVKPVSPGGVKYRFAFQLTPVSFASADVVLDSASFSSWISFATMVSPLRRRLATTSSASGGTPWSRGRSAMPDTCPFRAVTLPFLLAFSSSRRLRKRGWARSRSAAKCVTSLRRRTSGLGRSDTCE